MKKGLSLCVVVLSCIAVANLIALSMSMLLISIGEAGDATIPMGVLGLLTCFLLACFTKRAFEHIAMFATMSYMALLSGIDAHLAFHKTFGSQMVLKVCALVIFVTLMIVLIVMKNHDEAMRSKK